MSCSYTTNTTTSFAKLGAMYGVQPSLLASMNQNLPSSPYAPIPAGTVVTVPCAGMMSNAYSAAPYSAAPSSGTGAAPYSAAPSSGTGAAPYSAAPSSGTGAAPSSGVPLVTAFMNQARAASAQIQSLTSRDLAQAQQLTEGDCQSMLKKIMDKLGPIKTSPGETLSVSVGPINLIGGVNDWAVIFKSNSPSLLQAIQGAIPAAGTYSASAGTLSYPIDQLYKFAIGAEYCVMQYGNYNLSY